MGRLRSAHLLCSEFLYICIIRLCIYLISYFHNYTRERELACFIPTLHGYITNNPSCNSWLKSYTWFSLWWSLVIHTLTTLVCLEWSRKIIKNDPGLVLIGTQQLWNLTGGIKVNIYLYRYDKVQNGPCIDSTFVNEFRSL